MQQWQYQILAQPWEPSLFSTDSSGNALDWWPVSPDPQIPQQYWLYQSVALVVNPVEVSSEDVTPDMWQPQMAQPQFPVQVQHQAFFGEPWLEPSLYEVPDFDEWWNNTLDMPPVLEPARVSYDQFAWNPLDYALDVPEMAGWYRDFVHPTLRTPNHGGWFAVGLPPELTFTTPACPWRGPRPDESDSLRPQADAADDLRPRSDDDQHETPRLRRDECL